MDSRTTHQYAHSFLDAAAHIYAIPDEYASQDVYADADMDAGTSDLHTSADIYTGSKPYGRADLYSGGYPDTRTDFHEPSSQHTHSCPVDRTDNAAGYQYQDSAHPQ